MRGVVHQRWTHRRLGSERRLEVAKWPYMIEHEFEGVRTGFVHYGLGETGRDHMPIVRHPGVEELDRMFSGQDNELVFYGHDHRRSDRCGRARYCMVEFRRGGYEVEHRSVSYDDAPLYRAFEERDVPERAFIYKAFFGGRFGIK